MKARAARIAGVLLAAIVLYGMQHTTPLYSEITSPVVVRGVQGKRVETDEFVLGIARVHLTKRLVAPYRGDARPYTTSGIWIVVEGAIQAKTESLSLTSAEWIGADGVRHTMSQRLSVLPGLLGSERFDPGIPRPALMVFEVPESRISGASLSVSRSALVPLVEVAQVEMRDVRPDSVRSEIVLGRGGRLVPWTLEER